MNKSRWRMSLSENNWQSSSEAFAIPRLDQQTDVLGVPAESLEGVEVCIGDCQARDRPRLAKEAFHTLLVPIIPAQETRPTWDQCRYPKTGEDDGRSQCGLGRAKDSWRTAQARNRGFRTHRFPTDAEMEHSAVPDLANLPGQSHSGSGLDRLLYGAERQIARVVCLHCVVT